MVLLDIGNYRMRHEAINKLSQCADQTINYQATCIVLCNAIIVCLSMYVLIWVRIYIVQIIILIIIIIIIFIRINNYMYMVLIKHYTIIINSYITIGVN